MTRTVLALIALSVLLSVVQWAWMHVAAHVDQRLMPARARRRVNRISASTTRIQWCLAAVVSVAVAAQVAHTLG